MGWLLLKTVLSLTLVVGLMVGAIYLLKKYLIGPQVRSVSGVPIEVLGSVVLQQKNSLYLVKVFGRVLVIGISEGGMSTIAEFNPDEIAASILEENAGAPLNQSQPTTFVDYLKKQSGTFRLRGLNKSKNRDSDGKN
jgi:flagellar biosynthetic protein FliO